MAMDVALKIWRYDSSTGERELREYEVDAPEEATLLDCLDIVKDRQDGSLAYRKSCRMMICGSCGMRMDGAAVLACKTPMLEIAEAGHVPVISAMGNLPIVKDLVVDMEPFWGKIRAVEPWLQAGYSDPGDKEYVVSQEEMDVIHKESLCIMCGCCVSECNSMEADPDFLGPAALAKGMRFVGDARDEATVERLQAYSSEHGIWDCTRCYFCQERCPKGVDPRDAIAKLGAEAVSAGIDSDMGAKHAKWFVTSAKTTGWLRETELVPKTQGIVKSLTEMKFAMGLLRHGKVPPPVPPHVAKHVDESADGHHEDCRVGDSEHGGHCRDASIHGLEERHQGASHDDVENDDDHQSGDAESKQSFGVGQALRSEDRIPGRHESLDDAEVGQAGDDGQ